MFKLFDINSIRSRMVVSFLFLTILILIQSLVSFFTLDRTIQIARIHSDINQLEIFTLNLIKSDNDFFNMEVINPNYFETHKSVFLTRRDSLNKRIRTKLNEVARQSSNKSYNLDVTLHEIDSMLGLYNVKFSALETILFKKGFKDYGLEGEMRFHAHELEETNSGIDISNILYLRRHEKDFLLRHDQSYLRAFQARADIILTALGKKPGANKKAIEHLREYQKLFLALAELQTRIGASSKGGLRSELNDLTVQISEQYFSLSEYSFKQSTTAQQNTRLFYIAALVIGILISILTGYWISKRLSEPITRLSKLVNNSINSKNTHKTDFSLRNAAHEIVVLTASFIQLMNKTKDQLSEIRQKSRQLKQRNKQLRKVNKELDHFLYSTAHDLRSPLTSLSGLVHVMRLENKQPELIHYFDRMDKSIQRQENFIAQIASFSKNKIMKIKSEEIDLSNLLKELIEYHQFIPGADQIKKEITVQNPEDLPFYSDYNRITILLNNLLSNAIRYADFSKPNPFIQVDISIRKTEIAIDFADNGIGIAQEHLDKIFDMFYRAHADSKGSGLGLFIFDKTIKRMNGEVQVESEEGKGTTFHIRLPNLQSANVKIYETLAIR
jgi:signal transduction histidine kinase